MTLVHDTISNFLGGVSQQPDKVMFPNQAQELNNYLLNIADGLQKRPPMNHVKKIINTQLSVHPKCTTIIKEDEEYEVILTGSGIKVFDLAGNEKIVNIETAEVTAYESNTYTYTYVDKTYVKALDAKGKAIKNQYDFTYNYSLGNFIIHFTKREKTSKPASWSTVRLFPIDSEVFDENDIYYGKVTAINPAQNQVTIKREANTVTTYNPLTYITTQNPLEDLEMTSVGDYTFILNKTVNTEMYEELYPNPYPNSALIFVKQGDYGTDYTIKITYNGVEKSYTYQTSTTDVKTTKTNAIAKQLYNKMATGDSKLGTDWNVELQGSTILVNRIDKAPFSIVSVDSNADYDLYAFYKEANSVQTLPTTAPNDFIIKIVGEVVNEEDDYYVQFKTTDESNFGAGTWIECPSPECTYAIKAQTMPHGLVRESDGTFTLKILDWEQRNCGDENSAPTPSFIGNPIQEIFSHKGRIGFLSREKTCFSDVKNIFSFFKRTTLEELDTDPIDVTSNAKLVDLKHTLPFNEQLLVFSPTTQFSVVGGDVFSNTTVGINLTMNFQCSPKCKPVNSGSTAFFIYENGDYSKMMEIYTTSTYNLDAREVTEQIPSYIPKNIYKVVASAANNIACLISTSYKDTIYVYNYYYNSEQKNQSAWSKWTFDNAEILNIDFKDNFLYLIIQYSDGVYLNKINLSAKQKENNLNYLFYLDRKVYLSGTDLTYDSTNNRTTFTLPYEIDNDISVIDKKGFPHNYIVSNGTFSVEGEFDTLIIGNVYDSYWKMSKLFVRQQNSNGSMKVREGILMIRDINLTYTNSGYFKARVTPKYTTLITSDFDFGTITVTQEVEGQTSDFNYTGKIAGTVSATLGEVPVSDGTFLIPIIAKNDEIEVEIINDSYLPSDFLSLEWLGDFVIRGE